MGSVAQERDEVAAEEIHDVELAAATVEQGLLSATFTAPRRETVDGSGPGAARSRCSASRSRPSSCATAAPRVEAAAFLTAKAVNDTGFPLLAGDAGVYVGDEFVGPRAARRSRRRAASSSSPSARTSGSRSSARCSSGKRETAGLVSKDEVYRYRVRIEVKNRYATPVAVKLLDLVPVSRDEKIEVALLEGTTAATREDPERPGVRDPRARARRAARRRWSSSATRSATRAASAIAGLE